MKNNFLKNFYLRFLVNVIISSIIFFIIVIFFIYILFISEIGVSRNILDTRQFAVNENFLNLLLSFFLGIIVFTITFILLERKKYKNIDLIYKGINRISNGNINEEIIVDSDDEISIMAENLNIMQIKLQEIIERDRESERQKNELITNIAHDLRTPLTSILGYLEIIETNKKITDEKKMEYISIAYNKSKRLETLIDDLFAFTKLSFGKLPMNLLRIDIVKLINQLIEELYPLFEKNKIDYEFKSNVSSLDVLGDPKLLARLFDNLINNAIKYGKDGKKIIITLFKDGDNSYYVSVVNFGEIISDDIKHKLFEKFYRADKSRNSNVSGTGLGLAIAKNIAELHKGRIEVNSDKNGTEFKVLLKVDFDLENENLYE